MPPLKHRSTASKTSRTIVKRSNSYAKETEDIRQEEERGAGARTEMEKGYSSRDYRGDQHLA